MSILDCMCSFNGLIKECFAWVIEASSEADKMHFFFSSAVKIKCLGMEGFFFFFFFFSGVFFQGQIDIHIAMIFPIFG